MEAFSDLFHLPLSQVALIQMQNLVIASLSTIVLSEDKDNWSYTWGSRLFSSSRIYITLIEHPVVHPAFQWIWKSPYQPKHKVFFFWLLLKDQLSTRNILRRKNMVLETYNCVLCSLPIEETSDHLFLHSAFAMDCWNLLGVHIPADGRLPQVVSSLKARLQSKLFMVAIILMC